MRGRTVAAGVSDGAPRTAVVISGVTLAMGEDGTAAPISDDLTYGLVSSGGR